MKQKAIFMTMLALILFTACDKESTENNKREGLVWDVAPIEFCIFITDSEGHDLLDPASQTTLAKGVTVGYKGQVYPVQTERELYGQAYGSAVSRAYMPVFEGLVLRQVWNGNTSAYENYMLVFGEFSGEESIDKREITLTIPDGHQVSLAYRNTFHWNSDGSPQRNCQFFLDGQELWGCTGRSGIYHFQYSASQGLQYVQTEME